MMKKSRDIMPWCINQSKPIDQVLVAQCIVGEEGSVYGTSTTIAFVQEYSDRTGSNLSLGLDCSEPIKSRTIIL